MIGTLLGLAITILFAIVGIAFKAGLWQGSVNQWQRSVNRHLDDQDRQASDLHACVEGVKRTMEMHIRETAEHHKVVPR